MNQTDVLAAAGLAGIVLLGAAVLGGPSITAARQGNYTPPPSAVAAAPPVDSATAPAPDAEVVLVAAAAATAEPAEPAPAGDADGGVSEALMAEGAELFADNCAACHGPEGAGLNGPPLRANVASTRGVVRVMVNGRNTMPPMGASMSDHEIVALVTYVRNSWGNEFGPVSEEEVIEARKPLDF